MTARLLSTPWLASLPAPTLAGAVDVHVMPHFDQHASAQSVASQGQTFVNQGLIGTDTLPTATVDFLGDTLGSFSSLGIAPGSWRRVDDHDEAVLWTLPDRGRNDPAAGLFYDYPARLEHFCLRFTSAADKTGAGHAQMQLVPDGGLELKDFDGRPFTGADPGAGTRIEHGVLLPAPARGIGTSKISIDAESLQFAADGGFYVGDEYAAHVYRFDAQSRLADVLTPPAAVMPRTCRRIDFNALAPPNTGRRNNQGMEGISLSPDGTRLFVALQSALMQDSAKGSANGRVNTRVLVYDVSRQATPARPIGDYVLQLPAYTAHGDGSAPDETATQSEIRALNDHQFLMLARDSHGLGSGARLPSVYKSVLLADIGDATNLAGTPYETGTASMLRSPGCSELRLDIHAMPWVELVNLLDPLQLARFGIDLDVPADPHTLSGKWEAMDLASALDPARPHDYFLFVGNDNDFIARHCTMGGRHCDSPIDNDNRLLVYRFTLQTPPR